MKSNEVNTIIKLNIDGHNISLSDVVHNNFTHLNENNPSNRDMLEEDLKSIACSNITRITHLPNDRIMIILINNAKRCAVEISNYSVFKKKPYFKSMKKTILEYELAKLFNRLCKKVKSKPFRLSLTGSLLTVATAITFSQKSEASKAELDSINEAVQTVVESMETRVAQDDTLTINYFDIESIKEYNDNPTPIVKQEEDILNFDDLKSFNDYNDYIRFAAKLYYVDYNEAKRVVEEKFSSFQNSNHSELNRMKDLKDRGIINGDLNVIGIFITIKDYAIDVYSLDNQTPIKSNKSASEREKDLINVAQNIYGIDNIELLNCIVAIHRVETGNGTASLTTKKNNLGGNLSAKYKEKIVQNVYKTNEIGAESMVRNFLNIYDKCLYDEKCNYSDPTPIFMSQNYCTHTPNDWAIAVTDKINNSSVKDDVNSYLNSGSKTY